MKKALGSAKSKNFEEIENKLIQVLRRYPTSESLKIQKSSKPVPPKLKGYTRGKLLSTPMTKEQLEQMYIEGQKNLAIARGFVYEKLNEIFLSDSLSVYLKNYSKLLSLPTEKNPRISLGWWKGNKPKSPIKDQEKKKIISEVFNSMTTEEQRKLITFEMDSGWILWIEPRNFFDTFPLHTNFKTSTLEHMATISVESHQRAVANLIRIFLKLNPKMFFDHQLFRQTISNRLRSFSAALKIEPCLLQTDLGHEVLKGMSLWQTTHAESLGRALTPEKQRRSNKKNKTEDIDEAKEVRQKSEFEVLPVKAAILILSAECAKEFTELPDERCFNLLKSIGFSPLDLKFETYLKIRQKIFKKI